MVTIQSGNVCARISEDGAQLKSLRCGSEEYIWQGDPAIWADTAPILFPICSGLKDDRYILDGKTYTLQKHGFVRHAPFAVESVSKDSVTFLTRDNADTYEQFPFHFELRVTFSLSGKKLTVRYEVANTDTRRMYFSIGAHEGYACPEGVEAYDIVLPEKETLATSLLEGTVIGDRTQTVLVNSDTLPLKYSYFDEDALIFKGHRARSLQLRNRQTGRGVKVTFEGFPYLLIWSKPKAFAPYVCIEPWCGISDSIHTDQQFATKEGIEQVAAGETFVREHTIEICEGF